MPLSVIFYLFNKCFRLQCFPFWSLRFYNFSDFSAYLLFFFRILRQLFNIEKLHFNWNVQTFPFIYRKYRFRNRSNDFEMDLWKRRNRETALGVTILCEGLAALLPYVVGFTAILAIYFAESSDQYYSENATPSLCCSRYFAKCDTNFMLFPVFRKIPLDFLWNRIDSFFVAFLSAKPMKKINLKYLVYCKVLLVTTKRRKPLVYIFFVYCTLQPTLNEKMAFRRQHVLFLHRNFKLCVLVQILCSNHVVTAILKTCY